MTGVDYSTGTPAFEQRIGERVAIYGLEVSWIEPHEPGNGASRPARGPVRSRTFWVTGASIRGPTAMSIGPDLLAVIRYHDQDTVVSVHRRERTETPGMLRYGVEWVDLKSELKAHVFAALAPEHGARTAGT